MPSRPVVIIPAGSPTLESLARSIGAGAADVGGAGSLRVVIANSVAEAASAATASFLFLGLRPNSVLSVELARSTLSQLLGPNRVHVALFEATIRGSESGASADGRLTDPANMLPLVMSERFLIDHGVKGDFVGPDELDRARRWGATTYMEWRSKRPPSPSNERPGDPVWEESRSVPWCGATE